MQSLIQRVLLAALAVICLAGGLQANDLRVEFFADIRSLTDEGALDEAERRLEEAFLAAPDAPLDERVALLETLAEVQVRAARHADAGDTYLNEAQLLAREAGADSPDIAALYADAGDAYLNAEDYPRAAAAFEAALRLDRIYLECESDALADLYRKLADAQRGAGQAEAASEADRLAADPQARCALSPGGRSIERASRDSDGAFARVEIFYGTDRKPSGETRPDRFFGRDRGEIAYGTALVTIPRDHKPGQIEAPSLLKHGWSENPARHVVLRRVTALDERSFFSAVGESLAGGSSNEAFIFIHGFNVTFADAAKRTAQMAYDLNFEGAPILYSWPSRGLKSAYMADAATVQVSARRLTVFLEDVVARSGAERIHIVAHSMGNRALTEALELYALRQPEAEAVFDQIIFAAPDVDAGLFAIQASSIRRLARRLTLYTSSADLALTASRKLHGQMPRAGQGGDVPLVIDAVDTVDMSGLGAGLLRHSYFASEASALTDILWLFWRNPPPPSRCGMVEEAGSEGRYWVYLAGTCDDRALLPAITLARRHGLGALAHVDRVIGEMRTGIAAMEPGDLDRLAGVRAALVDLLDR